MIDDTNRSRQMILPQYDSTKRWKLVELFNIEGHQRIEYDYGSLSWLKFSNISVRYCLACLFVNNSDDVFNATWLLTQAALDLDNLAYSYAILFS